MGTPEHAAATWIPKNARPAQAAQPREYCTKMAVPREQPKLLCNRSNNSPVRRDKAMAIATRSGRIRVMIA